MTFLFVKPFNIDFIFQLLDVSDDDFLSLMDDAGNTRDDLKVPDGDIGEEIRSAINDGKDILVSSKMSFKRKESNTIESRSSAPSCPPSARRPSSPPRSTPPSTSK